MTLKTETRPELQKRVPLGEVQKLRFTEDKILTYNDVSQLNFSFFIVIPVMPITRPDLWYSRSRIS